MRILFYFRLFFCSIRYTFAHFSVASIVPVCPHQKSTQSLGPFFVKTNSHFMVHIAVVYQNIVFEKL